MNKLAVKKFRCVNDTFCFGSVVVLAVCFAGQAADQTKPKRGNGNNKINLLICQLVNEIRARLDSPPKDPSEERGVEALWWSQPPLNLGDGDFVLGCRAEEREAPRHRAEDVGGRGADEGQEVVARRFPRVLIPRSDGQVVVVHLKWGVSNTFINHR